MDDICPITKKPCLHAKSLHVTDIKNGVVTEVHMCPQCADQYLNPLPEKKPEPSSFGGVLGLLTLLFLGSKALRTLPEQPVSQCSGCGITPQEIAKTGRFGCSVCYEYFNNSIQTVLQNCQNGATNHVGKVPWFRLQLQHVYATGRQVLNQVPSNFEAEKEKRRLAQESMLDVKEQIRIMEEKMAKAIKLENYEVAGVLKSKIQELRKKLLNDLT